MSIEAVRQLAGRFLREAELNHVGEDDTVPGVYQRRNDVAVEESPSRIAVQELDRITGILIDVMHPPAIDPRVAGGEGPPITKPFDAFQHVRVHVPPLTL
jgi:hypothetical protein